MSGLWPFRTNLQTDAQSALVEVGAAQEVSAGCANEFAVVFFQARGAVGAEDGVVLERDGTDLRHRGPSSDGVEHCVLHCERVMQTRYSSAVERRGASNKVR